MARFVPLLAREQVERLSERAREVVEYRKSGVSLNHVHGGPLDCVYCIQHTDGLGDQRQPCALMSDAVNELVGHRYFQPHVTPVQVFNRATDPFLPNVRPHTVRRRGARLFPRRWNNVCCRRFRRSLRCFVKRRARCRMRMGCRTTTATTASENCATSARHLIPEQQRPRRVGRCRECAS